MRRFGNVMIYFLAIGVAGYAAVAYGLFPLGVFVHPDMRLAFQTHAAGLYSHVFASIVALLLGPFQFSSGLRQKNPDLHRWSGRLYLSVGVLLGGASGLYMAQFAFAGVVARAGFTLLAFGWLYTGWMAYRAIRQRDIENHRRWMVRNFSLTFAAVTLRLYLGLSFGAGIGFEDFYPVIAWLCWVPNLIWAEWFLNTSEKPEPESNYFR